MAATVAKRVSLSNLQSWLGAFGILYIALIFAILRGPIGLAVGASLAIIWYVFSPLVAFAFGHVVLLMFPGVVALEYPFVLVEGGLGCLLVSAASEVGELRQASIATGIVFVLLSLLVLSGQTLFDASWSTALLLVILMAFIAYSMHRYDRLILGLMEEL